MATKIGTEDRLEELLEDLIRLDYDAVQAYQAAIDRLHEESHRSALGEFVEDHLRHTRELGALLAAMGRTPPRQGGAKRYLAKGKAAIGGLLGDKAVLQAMRSTANDTSTAYERAVKFHGAPTATLDILERAREDAHREIDWFNSELKKG